MINNLFKSLIVQIAKIRLQLVKYQTYRVAIFAQIQKLRTVCCVAKECFGSPKRKKPVKRKKIN